MRLSPNPFTFGSPVRGVAFLDRRQALRRVGNMLRHGGSAVVSAEPRTGKTSLLLYLQEQAADLFGSEAAAWAFRYLDGHTFSGWDVPRFWRAVLRPLREGALGAVAQEAYAQAEGHEFDAQALEDLFHALQAAGQCLVLMLDEFDAVLDEPGLHHQRFYGPLRSLASRYPSFALAIATRRSITDLNTATRAFAAGSPYFNFAEEVPLPPFPQRDVDALLKRAGDAFTPQDRAFLRRVAGGHPYFLQVAAYYLWEEHHLADETGRSPEEQRVAAAKEAFAQAKNTLADTWQAWTPAMRLAFTLVALEHVPTLLEGRTFDMEKLKAQLALLRPELAKLARLGFLRVHPDAASGYEPEAEIMLWYLVDELTRLLRTEVEDLGAWLTAQEWDGLLTKGEKEALKRGLLQAGRLLLKVAHDITPLIQALVSRS